MDSTSHTTTDVLERFNRALLEHHPSLRPPLIPPDCVIERVNAMTLRGGLIVEGRGCTKGRP